MLSAQSDISRHFIVIGSMKSGTTSLYQHLLAHPDVCMSRMKETDYFVESQNWKLGAPWYQQQFENPDKVTGEVSPNYTKHDIFPGVAERIAAFNPATQLIFLARDPVDRFFSQYFHVLTMGHTTTQPKDLIGSKSGDHILETSRYAAQINTYLKVFPREQLLILDFAELKYTPQTTIDKVTGFLNLPAMTIGDIATTNDGKSIAAMPVFVQRLWRSRLMRRIDPLISRGFRDNARKLLSQGKAKPLPDIPDALRVTVAELLAEDAANFREISGLRLPDWKV